MHAPTAGVGGAQILCDAASNTDPIVNHRTMYWLTSTALHVPWNINGQFPFGVFYHFPNPLKDHMLCTSRLGYDDASPPLLTALPTGLVTVARPGRPPAVGSPEGLVSAAWTETQPRQPEISSPLMLLRRTQYGAV